MPIYEYRCLKCGEVSEFLVGIRPEDKTVTCKMCGSQEMQRIISPSFFSLKGTQRGGLTCCGNQERCDAPPCSTGESCRRDRTHGQR